jgi:hypothetical protein
MEFNPNFTYMLFYILPRTPQRLISSEYLLSHNISRSYASTVTSVPLILLVGTATVLVLLMAENLKIWKVG